MNEQKRFAGDINRAFDRHIEPCRCSKCRGADAMRFELEINELVEEQPFSAVAMVVCLQYGLAFRETAIYFATVKGLRLAQ